MKVAVVFTKVPFLSNVKISGEGDDGSLVYDVLCVRVWPRIHLYVSHLSFGSTILSAPTCNLTVVLIKTPLQFNIKLSSRDGDDESSILHYVPGYVNRWHLN